MHMFNICVHALVLYMIIYLWKCTSKETDCDSENTFFVYVLIKASQKWVNPPPQKLKIIMYVYVFYQLIKVSGSFI